MTTDTATIPATWQHGELPCAGQYFIYQLEEWCLWNYVPGSPEAETMCWFGPAFGPVPEETKFPPTPSPQPDDDDDDDCEPIGECENCGKDLFKGDIDKYLCERCLHKLENPVGDDDDA
jgi:hypothetical protein